MVEDVCDTESKIKTSADNTKIENIVKTTDFSTKTKHRDIVSEEKGTVPATFTAWLYGITKDSLGFVTTQQLKSKADILKEIYAKITYQKDGLSYFSSLYDKKTVEANIRKAFYEKRDFTTVEELIPDEASLLNISNFMSEITTNNPQNYFPTQSVVENILLDDKGKLKIDDKHQAIPELDSNIKKVIVYYVDITSEEEIHKFISEDDSTTVEIELRDLKTVLDDVIIEDYAEFHTGGYAVTIDKFASDRVQSKILEFNNKNLLNTKKKFIPITLSDDGLEMVEFLSLDCTSNNGEWHSDSEIKIDKNGYVIRNGERTKEFWDGKIRSEKKPFRLKIRNICGDETIWEA